MADHHAHCDVAALRKLAARLQLDLLECERKPCARLLALRSAQALVAGCCWHAFLILRRAFLMRWRFRLRWVSYAGGTLAGLVLIASALLWWRLGNGPIEFDIATPWLTAAIEENFGNQHQVEVGGAQIERDANGHAALRIRDIVVRDPDGSVVASAPKAEVGLSSGGFFSGHFRAQRLSLVGAEMQVRIEHDSRVTVFAGGNKRPLVTASAEQAPVRAGMTLASSGDRPVSLAAAVSTPIALAAPSTPRNAMPDFAALLAWIDSLGASGLDGHDLSELGLKSGNLTVADQRNGKEWVFHDINLSLTRPKAGSVALTISSGDPERPWLLRAALTPGDHNQRTIDIETQKLPAKELMLAMRVGDGQYDPDVPVSAHIRATLGPDGIPQILDGRVVLEKGSIVDVDEPLSKIAIDRAEFSLDWDAARQTLMVPFQIRSGGNRITLLAQLDAPTDHSGRWGMKISGGTVVLAADATDPAPLVLDRVLLRLRLDTEKQRLEIEQGEFGNVDLGLLASGHLDYAGGEPRLAAQLAGSRMSVAALKRLWPCLLNPKVRDWVEQHILSGTVERIVIATNAPMDTLRAGGPPIPDDGLAIDIAGNGAEINPVEGLPSIRDTDMSIRISGRTAKINIGRGTIEIAPNRKLSITNGVFDVPDTAIPAPPANVRFRIDGPVPAAAELLAVDRLREFSGAPIEPNTSRGTVSAQVILGLPLRPDLPPGTTQYAINADVANFAAERMVMGQKVEANNLRVTASNQGYQIKGDVKINGVPAALDYRRSSGDAEAEIRVTATLDDAARAKMGFDLGSYLAGPMPVKINGRVAANESESRLAVEADLTPARIDRLLPGWVKPPGKTARASFTLISNPQSSRFEDIVIESQGGLVKGAIEVNQAGEVVFANLPVFNLSDGDKALLKAERGPDGALRVMVRGDVYDGRAFVKSALGGPSSDRPKQFIKDVDVDVRLATVIGFHGETMRGLDVRMSRRGGAIKSFALSAKLGRNASLEGDLRRTAGRNALYVASEDAGAFFRFSDLYPKIFGGEMWVAMDPPGGDSQAPQEGVLSIRDFTVRGEPGLDRIATSSNSQGLPNGSANPPKPGVEFSRMRVEFSRTPGRFTIREGLVKGPVIGATSEGYIDYLNEDVHMRGTFVPLYGLNNMFGQIPIFGVFLGGSNEGLVGLTYEVAGPPSSPVLRVNPISVIAPGLIRKFFEFPTSGVPRPQSSIEPNR
jgi:hypothetical protein